MSPKNKDNLFFPFTSPKTRYYYLARYGIWHAVDVLGLKSGDIALMPAYFHGVEVEAYLRRGIKLKYYGVNEKFEIDIDCLESLISPEVKVIHLIHYFGFPQPITQIKELASFHNIFLFEDCALSLFSQVPEGPLGTFGDLSIFCLYKTLQLPHGGMLVINRPDLFLPPPVEPPNRGSTITYLTRNILQYYRLKGGFFGEKLIPPMFHLARIFKNASKIDVLPIDTNEFQEEHVNLGVSPVTKLLIEKFDPIDIVAKRRRNYLNLIDLLKDETDIPFKELPDGVCPLSLPIFVKKKEDVYLRLLDRNIETVNFWSIHHPDLRRGTFPKVELLREHILEIPIHQELDNKHIEFIASQVIKILRTYDCSFSMHNYT